MPACVREYDHSGSLQKCFEQQAGLIDTFRLDFAKYGGRCDLSTLNAVLSGVARLVGRQIKYSGLDEHHSHPTNKKAFDLLALARVVTPVRAVHELKAPLGGLASTRKFKSLLVDVGLWQNLVNMRIEHEFKREDLLDIYEGAMAEQFVGQELRTLQTGELFYWARQKLNSSAEVDYLIQKAGEVRPIEVKSGLSGRLKSLHLCLAENPSIKEGVVFSSRPMGELKEQKLKFLPLYYAGMPT